MAYCLCCFDRFASLLGSIFAGAPTPLQPKRPRAHVLRSTLLLTEAPTRYCLKLSPNITATHCRRDQLLERRLSVNATIKQTMDGKPWEMEESQEDVCELVSGLDLTLGEGDNSFDAHLVKAIKNNNGAAVLLLTDIYGFKDNDTRDFAYRLSCFGYNVLLPDLFHGEPWSKGRPMAEYEDWRAKHPPDRVLKDIETSARWLIDEMTVAGVSKKLGFVGFCYGGGRLIEALARDTQEQFAAAVFFYGTRFDLSLSSDIKVPILFICGDHDRFCSVDVVHAVANRVNGSETRIYPGRGHAFAHRPQSPEEDEDAEDAFTAMRSWLHDKLIGEA